MTHQKAAPLQIGFGLDELRAVLAAIGPKLFITVTEFSEYTRVDPRTVRRAIEDGQVPAVRIGNAVRIPTAGFLRMAEIAELEREDTPDSSEGEPGSPPVASTPTPTKTIGHIHHDLPRG
jgi:excisionase family DNA binding protein